MSLIHAWCNILSHRWSGNSLSRLPIPVTKWFFHVLISIYIALCLCMFGGTSWKSISNSLSKFFNASNASFSIQCFFGWNPLVLRWSYHFLYALSISFPLISFNGSVKMALKSYTFVTNTFLGPGWKLQGTVRFGLCRPSYLMLVFLLAAVLPGSILSFSVNCFLFILYSSLFGPYVRLQWLGSLGDSA